jgi:hypothetical protein
MWRSAGGISGPVVPTSTSDGSVRLQAVLRPPEDLFTIVTEVRPGKLTGSSYSNAKMRLQSFFMLITVQDRVFAS